MSWHFVGKPRVNQSLVQAAPQGLPHTSDSSLLFSFLFIHAAVVVIGGIVPGGSVRRKRGRNCMASRVSMMKGENGSSGQEQIFSVFLIGARDGKRQLVGNIVAEQAWPEGILYNVLLERAGVHIVPLLFAEVSRSVESSFPDA
jgi:hypothetical protein